MSIPGMVVAFLLPFFVVLLTIPVLIRFAYYIRFVDVPGGLSKTHDQPVPYLGGLGVYMATLITLAICMPARTLEILLLFFIFLALLLILGLVDDFCVLRAHEKLIGQLVIVTFFFYGIGLELPYPTTTFLFFWMLLVINAFNLVDVMDGLASTLAISGLLSLSMIAFCSCKSEPMTTLIIAFLGALVGFLWYNKPSACIYLGDAGSLLLGGLFAMMPFLMSYTMFDQQGNSLCGMADSLLIRIFIVATIIIIPLCEVVGLIFIRSYKKIPFYRASPDHFSHYLLKRGWSKYKILSYTALFASISGCTTFLYATEYIMLFPYTLIIGGVLSLWTINLAHGAHVNS